MPLTLEIVTPEARVYSETVDSVVIPTVEGEVGILPGHVPLMTQVGAGELRATKGSKTELLSSEAASRRSPPRRSRSWRTARSRSSRSTSTWSRTR